MDFTILAQLNESYRHGVYAEETLSQEELVSIEEWVEALIEEGYDLDQFSDEELYEAYLEEARIDAGKSKEEKIIVRRRRQGADRDWDYDDTNRQALHRSERGQRRQQPRVRYGSSIPGINSREQEFLKTLSPEERTKRMAQNKRGAGRKLPKVNLPEELDLYDIVSEYLVSEGFCDSYEDADVIMANMSEEWRESILEETKKK